MSMLTALAELADRRPRAIVGAAVVAAIVAAFFGASTPSRLTSSDDDFQDSRSESFRTLAVLSRATDVLPGPSLIVVGSPREAASAAARLRSAPQVALVRGQAAVSRDRRLVLVAAWFRSDRSPRLDAL